MPHRRKGAPGSFGAPLDELLPRLARPQSDTIKVDFHRKPSECEPANAADECRIFLLNQALYERATR